VKTWKQGAIGSIALKSGNEVFVKCLKYPLAIFFKNYCFEKVTPEGSLFYAFLDLSVLKEIERVNVIKMTANDKKSSSLFSIDYQSSRICANQELRVAQSGLMKIDDIEQIMNAMRNIQ